MLGAVVQLAVLALLTRLGLHYLIATAIAVETAVLHNYFWHLRWTWLDRPPASRWGALLRFNLANGVVSLLSNLVLMRVLTGWLGMRGKILQRFGSIRAVCQKWRTSMSPRFSCSR